MLSMGLEKKLNWLDALKSRVSEELIKEDTLLICKE
jgi:hypothetical protein